MEDVNSFEAGADASVPQQLEVVEVATPIEGERPAPTEDEIEALAAEAVRLEALHDELRTELVGQDQQPSQ